MGLASPIDRRAAGRHVARRDQLDALTDLAGTASSERPCLATSSSAASVIRIRVSTRSWPMPRRGSAFSFSTSWRTVSLPSPTTFAGTRSRDGGELAADDQHAVVIARDERLHDHVATSALVEGDRIGAPDIIVRAQIEAYAPPVVAVQRLDHDRIADLRRRRRPPCRPTGPPPTSAPAGRPMTAGCWSGSCWTRYRRRSRPFATSWLRGCAAGERPGRAAPASDGRAGSTGCRAIRPHRSVRRLTVRKPALGEQDQSVERVRRSRTETSQEPRGG